MILTPFIGADEGLWLFNQAPVQAIERAYGFKAPPEFLDRLRLAAVRFNSGGTGSFVSPQGLLYTNHHVAADCIQKVSTARNDYLKHGFLAAAEADEKPCPDLEVNVLLNISNVTGRVNEGVDPAAPAAEANRLKKANMSALEKECATRTGNRCDAVTLFSGAQYHLYEYKKYTDVRLVFAPEFGIAFFGGDPDNFTYPRYALDVAFLRAYENGRPAKTTNWFRWSKEGVREGELIFTSGNPGATGRLMTVAQLEYLGQVAYPLVLRRLDSLAAVLLEYSKHGTEQERTAKDVLFGVQNSLKAANGFQRGLLDPSLMERKRAEERKLRDAIAQQPAQAAKFGRLWDELAAAYAAFRPAHPEYYLLETSATAGCGLCAIARRVVRYAAETRKPDAERLRELNEAGLASFEQAMYSSAPIHPELDIAVLGEYLRFMQRELGAQHPAVRQLLGGRSPAEAAAGFVNSSKLADVEERKKLAANWQAVERSEEGMIRFALLIDQPAREARKRYEDGVESIVNRAAAQIAQARFELSGGGDYPDATFTLRLAYGKVAGYRNGRGEAVPWTTDFGGLYAKGRKEDPYIIPESWLKARPALNLKTPFNFAATADIHGGNSGSATLNRKGEVVGIVFDSNLEALPNRFLYTDAQARSVHVASQAVTEALRKIYKADKLLKELGF
jgi:hypothetical protein